MKNDNCPRVKGLKKSERIRLFSDFLKKQYPDAPCALEYGGDPFKLLVMARLSAQCTDKRVNEVSKTLFRRFPTVFDMADATLSEIEDIIRPCGLFRTKAKSLHSMAKAIAQSGGKVPHTYEELIALDGVGLKIANLVLGDVFGDSRIVPDTHCMRISNKLGLVSKKEPKTCERELSRLIEKSEQSDFCHRIVLFGREYCKAPTPLCDTCPFLKNLSKEENE